jgi:uncharacterized protein YeaO (DUF488 family)
LNISEEEGMIQRFQRSVNLIGSYCLRITFHEKNSVNLSPGAFRKFNSDFRIYSSFRFVILLCSLAVIISCTTEKKPDMSKSWDPVVKDLEIVLISPESDSMKAVQIREIFHKYKTTFEEYREFYESMLPQSATQNIEFLKKVEKTISETMSAQAREEQKLYNRQIIIPQNQDSTRFKKEIRE